MSRFYGSMQGNRGEATRQGSANSAMYAHIRGWDIGASVKCGVGPDGNDRVTVSITRGSNGHGTERPLGTFRISAGGRNIHRTKD